MDGDVVELGAAQKEADSVEVVVAIQRSAVVAAEEISEAVEVILEAGVVILEAVEAISEVVVAISEVVVEISEEAGAVLVNREGLYFFFLIFLSNLISIAAYSLRTSQPLSTLVFPIILKMIS